MSEWCIVTSLQELAARQAAGDEIAFFACGAWVPWDGRTWADTTAYRARAADPYAALKAAAKDPTKQIKFSPGPWRDAGYAWMFNAPIGRYKIRDKSVDPYAALKAAAKDPTKQIKFGDHEWQDAGYLWIFRAPADMYEIRDKPVDPYAELKAAAKDPTKQIKCSPGPWRDDGYPWLFNRAANEYEIRDKPKGKTIKLEAFVDKTNGELFWRKEGTWSPSTIYLRVPSEDKTIEAEE